ncbi:transcriptional regulator CynR [Cupriavidus plantarum]|uniref:LysR family transcriptional regulator n=1 Tax=Cupriavidus plantarum TaxID=942865 RepID=A0A316ELM8_9BURK|nr:transcriptional regulator CynR [Cupriavidus plantarum]NYI02324.1 LysR family cyn operon transcriptional activator [Cupriavidus plantarum]PWK33019.1 LysR family transcriptional regulator [Cupriavidus plantarum]REE88716.1 LysR family transcriptional regulator [Cupriavidus plantarum]RLK31020.1 LysR family transcriptional regulator [Cupriavidus plantarum]CAG2146146.1 HTH-type transcriptional regulator CynR [Cupriavidus plantarum]
MLLRHIRYFLAVAETGNFTRAAELVHVSQPTLSQQIRQLEDALGAQLFDRTGRTTRLTDAGEAYLVHARRAIHDLEAGRRAIHDVGELTRGNLRLGMTPTFTPYLFSQLVVAFNARYPNISLSIREMPQERVEPLLADDAIDIGIAFDDIHLPEVEALSLFEEALSLMVGIQHPHAKRRTALKAADLERESMALLTREFATRGYIERYFAPLGIVPKIMIEMNSVSGVIEAVRSGRFATVLPSAIANVHDDLRILKLEVPLPPRRAALLQRKGAYQTAAARAFIAFAMEGLETMLPTAGAPLPTPPHGAGSAV